MKTTNILLISPQDNTWRITKNTILFYPLSLPIIAAWTPDDIDVKIVDEKVDELDLDYRCDLVGITATTANVNRAYRLADEFRKRGTKVVMGGAHVSFMQDEALSHADSIVVGEAEGHWPALIHDLRNNNLQRTYCSNDVFDLSEYRSPRVDLVDSNKYVMQHLVETSRGCPHNCEFCSVTKFFGNKVRFRPIDNVVDEIVQRKAKRVLFIDDNIFSSPKRSKELFRALIPLKIRWWGQSSILFGYDEEALELARQSGCELLFIGFESISKKNLEICRKKINIARDYEECIDNLHKSDIKILGSFIFGFEDDDEKSLKDTVRFAIRNRLELVHFTCLTPVPGSDLFRRMELQNTITEKDWDRFDFRNMVYEVENINPEMLVGALKNFYSFRSMVKRFGYFPMSRGKVRFIMFNLYYAFKYRREENRLIFKYYNLVASYLMKITKTNN